MLHFDNEEEFESYTSNPEEADRESARRQLTRMFPDLDEEEYIELEEGQLMRLTLTRVMDTMLHLKGPAYSSERTFNNEVFYKAKEEAYDLMLWLESEEDAPKPKSLVYKAPADDITETVEAQVEVVDVGAKDSRPNTGPYNRRVRGPSPNSKYQQAAVIVKEALAKGASRQDTIKVLIETFTLNKPTAESYYSKVKAEVVAA